MSGLELVFWMAVGLVGYTYAGYPLFLWLLTRIWPGQASAATADPASPADWPFVSLVIAAYKEEAIILHRVHNALQMDYPADLLEVIIGCDGAEDETAAVASTVDDSRMQVMSFPHRRGKPSVLNDCVARARGDLVAFSDANTFWDPAALKLLVRRFQNPRVGGVCGQLFLIDPETGENVDGLYWQYENFLKRCEARLGAQLGFNGAIYAIRRSLWEPIPSQTIVDDFLIGMRLRLQRTRVEFEERATAIEDSAPNISAEFHRRARIGAGGFQSLTWLWPLLSPTYGSVAFAFWSHKVLRWLCPAFLLLAFMTNFLLVGKSVYLALYGIQVLFYAAAVLGHVLPGRGTASRLMRLSSLFVDMNIALAVGFWRWLKGRQSGAWKRTARSGESARPKTRVKQFS